MAHKYDLLLVNTEREGNNKHRPWYRERLKTKYINPQKSKQCSGTLVGSSWTFLQKGLDDFRDGIPPDIAAERMVLRGYKGIFPNDVSKSNAGSPGENNTTNGKRFTKDEVVYAKTLPMQQQRRDNVDDIEMSLLQHQLALFPHLEESVPPEVFEDVVDILDPDLQLGSEEGTDMDVSCDDLDESQTRQSSRRMQSISPTETDRKSSAQDIRKNRYRWLPKLDETQKEEKIKSNRKKVDTPSLDDKIQNVTKEFCSWVESLGGETNNIEESTVMSLFASGYETKPTLSVPIHVVELTNVPPELRVNASTSASALQQNVDINEAENSLNRSKYTPSWVKVKYGAWYLNPKTWKKQKGGETLEDPKKEQENILSEAKAESEKLDNELATLHGARAFKSFVDKKGSRKPEFLSVVEKLQEEDRIPSIETRSTGPAVATPGTSNTLPSVAVISPSESPTRLV